MKLIRLDIDEKGKNQIIEFNESIIFPVENIECCIFNEWDIFRFSGLFSFFKPLGHNIAIVHISDRYDEVYNIIQHYPKFIYINNGNIFLNISFEPSSQFTNNYNLEFVDEFFPVLERYTDMEGNVNPLLIFLSLIRRNHSNMEYLEKIVQIGFPYKKIIDKNRRKIVDNTIFEVIPNQSEGVIYSGFKKEVNPLIEEYASFFGILSHAQGIKENIPHFIEKKINEVLSKHRIRESNFIKPIIRSFVFTISHPEEVVLKEIIEELKTHKGIKFDLEQSLSISAKLLEFKMSEYRTFIEEIGKWDITPEIIGHYIRVEFYGRIPINKFDEYKSNVVEILQNIFRKISVPEREISLRIKGIGLLIPENYYESSYGTFYEFINKFDLHIKTAARIRKVFSYIGEDACIDFELPFGENLLGIHFYNRDEEILENAHLLTKIAVKYILNGYHSKGKDLLHATRKAIAEDLEFLENRNHPLYNELEIYADRYDDKIVKSLANRNPPIIHYDANQCMKFYKINNKYLNFTEKDETLCSFPSFLDVKKHLREAPNSKIFRKYLYIYITILLAMGINEDYIGDLLFTVKFFLI